MKLEERSRPTEIEFGFRYAKKGVRGRIIRMASEIAWLRLRLNRREQQLNSSVEMIRKLELQISDLEYKLRG